MPTLTAIQPPVNIDMRERERKRVVARLRRAARHHQMRIRTTRYRDAVAYRLEIPLDVRRGEQRWFSLEKLCEYLHVEKNAA